jgi:hypothetical protein
MAAEKASPSPQYVLWRGCGISGYFQPEEVILAMAFKPCFSEMFCFDFKKYFGVQQTLSFAM